jgi:hypothetical protein
MIKQELYRVLRDIDDDENAEKEAIRAKYKALYAEKQKQKDITTTSRENNELKLAMRPDDLSTKAEEEEKAPLINAEELKAPLAIAEDELSNDSDKTEKKSETETDENDESENEEDRKELKRNPTGKILKNLLLFPQIIT